MLDFEISADFTWNHKSSLKDCIGLTFRDKGADFYLYRLCDNGSAAFYDYYESGEEKWKSYRYARIYQLYHQDKNNLKVRCDHEKMYFFVNDSLVLEMEDSKPTAGTIHIYTEADNNSTIEVAVDNIILRTPP